MGLYEHLLLQPHFNFQDDGKLIRIKKFNRKSSCSGGTDASVVYRTRLTDERYRRQ